MDDIRAELFRSKRIAVIDHLLAHGEAMVKAMHLGETDSRLSKYCFDLVRDPDAHNLWELLALVRFHTFMGKYEYRAKEVKGAIIVLETVPFVTPKGMRPLKLSPVQVFLLAGIYGFYRQDGRRLCRRAMLFVPRKFGKTTIVSGIAIKELLYGDKDGQVFACANSYQQAKICFDNIRNSLKALDKSGNRFKVNREVIFNQMKGRTSFARCLAADPSTLDGLNASCYILDEFSQSKSADLRNVMSTSTGTRDNPLELIITTASDLQVGPCIDTLESYKNILLGETEDDSVFALIFQPDIDDKEDDPKTWHKVQPHLGVTIKEDYYVEKYKEAMQTQDNMLAFRTKLLNVFAQNESKKWITGDEIRALFKPFSFDDQQGMPYCMVAFDLSVWDDFSAVAYEIHQPDTGTMHFHVDYYLPEDSVDNHPRRDLYRSWAEKGMLKLLPGKTIDYDLIIQDIISRNGKVLIAGIGYDPYHSKSAVNMLQAAGAGSVLHGIKQTYGAFTGAVEVLEKMVKEKLCTFTPNEITAWCFGNCLMDEDKIGNRKPIKARHSDKIDGTICCLMCQDQYNNLQR